MIRPHIVFGKFTCVRAEAAFGVLRFYVLLNRMVAEVDCLAVIGKAEFTTGEPEVEERWF